MNLLQGIIENKPNQLRNLFQHVLFCIADRIPHDQISRNSFQQDMVWIALLDCIETVGD